MSSSLCNSFNLKRPLKVKTLKKQLSWKKLLEKPLWTMIQVKKICVQRIVDNGQALYVIFFTYYMIASLQTAIREERYHDASRICSQTGSGLVNFILPLSC